MWDSLLLIITKRWYVLSFLISFLAIGSAHWGWKRTVKLLILGYFIAWASEASSIRWGFPYGMYYYHYDVMQGEPMFYGVPVWDSLSYAFLSFAGFMMALFLRARWNRTAPLPKLQASWLTVLLGALLTMILDVVIDPVAHLGNRWFLGDIYHYPEGGLYFDVPLSNFAGWFLVALCILGAFRLTDRLEGVPQKPATIWLGVLFFWGIYLFNWGITLYLQVWPLAAASGVWGVVLLLFSRKRDLKMVQD